MPALSLFTTFLTPWEHAYVRMYIRTYSMHRCNIIILRASGYAKLIQLLGMWWVFHKLIIHNCALIIKAERQKARDEEMRHSQQEEMRRWVDIIVYHQKLYKNVEVYINFNIAHGVIIMHSILIAGSDLSDLIHPGNKTNQRYIHFKYTRLYRFFLICHFNIV